ncbi:leucine-rich repeat domain-containing protein [Eubacterium xylanophilum]|uniref:leucine-rich repeat domain-containing protein n=1 Tax=Eubacterium xylanophilum TaxID=39497 RepID=UPI000479607E|nr:leucine-rich repeat domain-containing protein [Eubacterium xylanophilum]
MKVRIRKTVAIILCICMCVTPLSIEAKTKKTSGKDGKNITWNYDKQTKTLTFSGSGPISDFEMDGHSAEPGWYDWSEKAEHVVIEEGITVIGEMALYHFMNVKSVKLPETLTEIKCDAFEYNLELKNINLPESLKTIGEGAFELCRKLEISEMPKNVKRIGEGAFENCQTIKKFTFPNNVRKIERRVMGDNRNLQDVRLSSNATRICGGAFYNCKKLKVLDIPKSVTRVAMSAFKGSGLKKIVLPENVKRIDNGNEDGRKVFKKRYGLLPTKNLRVIEIHSKKVKKIEKNSFGGLSRKVVIKVPKSVKKKYIKMLKKSGLSKKIRIKALKKK